MNPKVAAWIALTVTLILGAGLAVLSYGNTRFALGLTALALALGCIVLKVTGNYGPFALDLVGALIGIGLVTSLMALVVPFVERPMVLVGYGLFMLIEAALLLGLYKSSQRQDHKSQPPQPA
jgi:hypothetical protein